MNEECKKYLKFAKIPVTFPIFSVSWRHYPFKINPFGKRFEKVINEQEDFVCIIKLKNDNVFGEDTFGVGKRETGEQLIL